MMSYFSEYKRFPSLKRAQNLIWLLKIYDIPFEIEDSVKRYESNTIVMVNLQAEDISKVIELERTNTDFSKLDTKYKYTFLQYYSENELNEILQNSELPNDELIEAKKILYQKSHKILQKPQRVKKQENDEKAVVRVKYIIACIIAAACSLACILQNTSKDESNLSKFDKIVLTAKPTTKSYSSKGVVYKHIEFQFEGQAEVFKISETDYNYANREAINNLNKGDTINIYFEWNEIYLLSRGNTQYCDLKSANKARNRKNKMYLSISLVNFLLFLIVSIKTPKYPFELIAALAFCLSLLTLFICGK